MNAYPGGDRYPGPPSEEGWVGSGSPEHHWTARYRPHVPHPRTRERWSVALGIVVILLGALFIQICL